MSCEQADLTKGLPNTLRFGPTAIRFKNQEPFSPLCPIRLIRATNKNNEATVASTLFDYPNDFAGERTVYATGCLCIFPLPVSVKIDEIYSLSSRLQVQVQITDNENNVFPFNKKFKVVYLDIGEWTYNFEDYKIIIFQDRFNVFHASFEHLSDDPELQFNTELELELIEAENNYLLFSKDNVEVPYLDITDGKITLTTGAI